MSANEPQSASSPTRPPRMVRLKSAAWVAGILVVVALGVWAWKSAECAAVSRQCDEALRAASEQSAQNLAKSIAIFGNKLIVRRDYQGLQDYADSLVRSKRIAYIAITDLRNGDRAVVHTNREFLGKSLSPSAPSSEVVDASVSVMDLTKQIGTVQVGVRLK